MASELIVPQSKNNSHHHHHQKHSPQEVHERHLANERLVIEEQHAAQNSITAVNISHEAIKAAIQKSIVVWRETRKTRQEWNAERKRDVAVCKKVTKADTLSDQIENTGKIGYAGIETDPIPYLRSYNFAAFGMAMKGLHPKRSDFHAIRCLDFSGQLIGDEKLIQVCPNLKRCPLHTLNLGYNEITDKGMQELALNLRSLMNLTDLLLAGNRFSDRGVQALFESDCYSPTLKKIDLSCNNVGPRSAYFIGLMFSPERPCQLDSLYLGGKVGQKGWGNEFVRVLVDHLCRAGARPLRRLSIPAAALSGDGIRSLSALITCTTSLKVLNITNNTLLEPESRNALRHALRINSSIDELYFRQSGLNRKQRDILQHAWKATYRLTWHERVEIALRTAFELYKGSEISHKIELDLFNSWQMGKPILWPFIEGIPPPDDQVDQDPLTADLLDLTQNMNPIKSIAVGVKHADGSLAYIRTMESLVIQSLQFLRDTVELYGLELDNYINTTQSERACHRRKMISQAKRIEAIGALEKFSGCKAELAGQPSQDDESTDKKKKKKKSRGGAINMNTLLMSIEDYCSCIIEHGDALELHVGSIYLSKLDLEDAQGKMSVVTSLSVGRQQKTVPVKRSLEWIPSLSTLGYESAFVHYVYTVGPAERLRVQKSAEAFERDRKRAEEQRLKAEKKKKFVRRVGPRFQIIRDGGLSKRVLAETTMSADTADISSLGSSDTSRTGFHRRGGVGFVQPLEMEADENEDEGSDDEDNGDGRSREVTRFTVPKRDMQRKFEALEIEDLTDNQAVIKTIKSALARGTRSIVVRRTGHDITLPRTVGLNYVDGTVTFRVYTEFEEERGEPLQHITRLNTTRPAVALEGRTLQRKLKRRQERERAVLS